MIQILPVLLAADWEDALKGVGALLVVAYWIFSALSDAKKQAPAQPKGRQQPAGAPEPAPVAPVDAAARDNAPGPVAKPVEDSVRAEVEEFLRRVRQQGDGEQRQPKPAPERRRPRIEVLVDERGNQTTPPPNRPAINKERQAMPPLRRQEPPAIAANREPVQAPVPPVEPVRLEQRHLAESAVAEHARHLGEQLGRTDRIEAHLHQKFDHAVGTLAARDAEPEKQLAELLATSPAENLAALLGTPQGMQQAIVLGEILRRPTDRW